MIALALLMALLPGCGTGAEELPAPAELFAWLQAEVELPEMVDTAETDLEALTGIGLDRCDGAVCFRLREGTAPDEIIIVRGRDERAAEEVRERLEKRLEDKREAGRLYLTEYQPMLEAGVVRRDGLTVSLIVSQRAEEIGRVYDGLRNPGKK